MESPLINLANTGTALLNSAMDAPKNILGEIAGGIVKLIVAVIVVILIILMVLFGLGFLAGFKFAGVSAGKESYGTTGDLMGILQSGQDNPLIAAGDQKEGMKATEKDFPMQNAKPDANGNPTVMPSYDGVDGFGEFKYATDELEKDSGIRRKFYLVKDKDGKYVLDKEGNYIWVTLDDLDWFSHRMPSVILGDLKTDWSDERTRIAYAAKCKVAGVDDKPDPYGDALRAAGYLSNPGGPFEAFEAKTTSNQAAKIDEQLAKSMLGVA